MFRKWGEVMKENGEYSSQDEFDDIFARDDESYDDDNNVIL